MREQITKYRALERVALDLVDLDVNADGLARLVGKIKRSAKKAFNTKEPPRNTHLADARAKATEAMQARAKKFRALVAPKIAEAQREGAVTRRQIADWLNDHDVPTSRGGEWSAGTVHRFMDGND